MKKFFLLTREYFFVAFQGFIVQVTEDTFKKDIYLFSNEEYNISIRL